MADDRSNYAGLAAASVFLVGLLIVGNSAVRIAVSGVIALAIALALSPTASRRLLVWAIAFAVCGALVAYNAASCQFTGKADYCDGHGRWGLGTVPVTREGSPTKFRQASNNTWAGSLLLVLVSAGCLMFHRKLESAEYDPNL